MRVALADVEAPALDRTVAEFRAAGHEAIGVPTDVSDAESVERLAERVLAEFGAVHVVCNNAGVGGANAASYRASLRDWEWTLGVNLWGVIHGVRTFVPIMLDQGGPATGREQVPSGHSGHIVNTASTAGLTPLPGNAPYGVSKYGVVALSEALYVELAQRGAPIGVSVLCPGLTRTNIMRSGRNRPAGLRNEDGGGGDAALPDSFLRAIDAAMPADRVAERVFEAVRDGRFWVLTHDEVDAAIRSRFDSLLSRENPPVPDRRFS